MEIDFEEQVQGAGQRVLPAREARWGPQPGSLEQAGEPLSPAGAVIGVIQAHEGRGQPEPFVFLHLPAQPSLCRRRLSPPRISSSYFLALQRWPGSTAGAGSSRHGQQRVRSVLATDQP